VTPETCARRESIESTIAWPASRAVVDVFTSRPISATISAPYSTSVRLPRAAS